MPRQWHIAFRFLILNCALLNASPFARNRHFDSALRRIDWRKFQNRRVFWLAVFCKRPSVATFGFGMPFDFRTSRQLHPTLLSSETDQPQLWS